MSMSEKEEDSGIQAAGGGGRVKTTETEEGSEEGGDDEDDVEEADEEEKSSQRSPTNQGSKKRNHESTQEELTSSILQKRARQKQSLGTIPYSAAAMLNPSDIGLHNSQQQHPPPAPFPSPYFHPYAAMTATTHMYPPQFMPPDPSSSSSSKKLIALDNHNYNNHKNSAKEKTHDSEKEPANFMPQQPPMPTQQMYAPLMFFPSFGPSQGFGITQPPPPPPPAYFMNPAAGGSSSSSSSSTAAMMAGGMIGTHSGGFMAHPPPPMMMMKFPNRGINLAMQCDAEQLSEYQILVRQQLELFEASVEDVESNTQGRKKPVVLGQVGLRCKHCLFVPLRSRGRGSVYYPARLLGVYQAAQNMAGSHLCNSCQQIPLQIKEELKQLRSRKDNASGGKQYWADACRALGIVETDHGLKLKRDDGGGPPMDLIQQRDDKASDDGNEEAED